MLLWLDFETTGLSPAIDRILEVGWLISNEDLTPRQSGPARSAVITPSTVAWGLIEDDQFIQDMHGKNGLLDALAQPGTVERMDAERQILSDIDHYAETSDEQVILAGSGIHFDKQFIDLWMPKLASRLHYRIFDTSSIGRFFDPLGVHHGVEESGNHRAGDDVDVAIAKVRSYAQTVNDLVRVVHAFKEGEL